MRLVPVLALAVCVAACTESPNAARPAPVDAGARVTDGPAPITDVTAADVKPATDVTATDAATTGFAPCATPDACGWIEAYQREVVGKLSGERPIAEGVTLTRRSAPAQRETARMYLRDEFRAIGVEVDFHTYATGANVRARLPATTGADASRIVVGAHYDGVAAGPAAADDGTGVAIVLVAARYLAGLPRRDHPIEFVLFDQEEVGLIGSAAYATMLRTEGVTLDSAHAFDMLSFDGDGDNAIELWSPSAGLEALYRQHATPRGIPVTAVRFASSDHQSFLTRSLPAVGVGEEFVGNDHTPHYHRVTDTFDRVDFGYLLRMTRLALDVLADRAVD